MAKRTKDSEEAEATEVATVEEIGLTLSMTLSMIAIARKRHLYTPTYNLDLFFSNIYLSLLLYYC